MHSGHRPKPRSVVRTQNNASRLQSLVISCTRQSCLLPHHQRHKRGEGGGREGRQEPPPPTPARSRLLSGQGKASNEGPADAAEPAVSAWEPRGAAGRASLLPISTQVLHQSARLLPGAEARGTALLAVGGDRSPPTRPGLCPLPFWLGGGVQSPPSPPPNSLTPSPINQLRADAVTPGDVLMKMADINLFPLPTGQFIVPWGALAFGQRA